MWIELWLTILKKREALRRSFDYFDYHLIALYDEEKIGELMNNSDIIRSKSKILAIIHNAQLFLTIQEQYKSFDQYIWSFVNDKIQIYEEYVNGQIPNHNDISDALSKDLKVKGFKYCGSITMFSHLEAAGLIHDHQTYCYKFHENDNFDFTKKDEIYEQTHKKKVT